MTALGLVTDAALQCQIIEGASHRAPYWMLRRSIILFDELTKGVDLSEYRERLDADYEVDSDGENNQLYRELYQQLEGHGFKLRPFDVSRAETLELRRLYDSKLEYLIDELLAPRGFWATRSVCGRPLVIVSLTSGSRRGVSDLVL